MNHYIVYHIFSNKAMLMDQNIPLALHFNYDISDMRNWTYMTHISNLFEYVIRVYPNSTLILRPLAFLLQECNDETPCRLRSAG